MVPLMPFYEQGPRYSQAFAGLPVNPYTNTFAPWQGQVESLLCPSSPLPPNALYPLLAQRNYQFCVGTTITTIYDGTTNGIFSFQTLGATAANLCTGGNMQREFRDITDGSSNTIAVSERGLPPDPHPNSLTIHGQSVFPYAAANLVANPAICLATAVNKKYTVPTANISNFTSGNLWSFGHPHWGAFNTVLPPNSPSCYPGPANPSNQPGIFSASSYHPGGVMVTMGDASVRFIADTIDCGNYGVAPNPNFGVWGGLGTRNGGEAVALP
jgi:hypothetical protein